MVCEDSKGLGGLDLEAGMGISAMRLSSGAAGPSLRVCICACVCVWQDLKRVSYFDACYTTQGWPTHQDVKSTYEVGSREYRG